MTEKEMNQLRENYNFWKNISRGFVEDETGDRIIHINGRDIVGYWVYGYALPIEDDMYIYGGRTVDDINKPVKKHKIVFDSHHRCTGLLCETEDGKFKPIFMYDVVIAKNRIKTMVNLTVFWDATKCGWYLCNFEEEFRDSIQMTASMKYKVTGTVFDKNSLAVLTACEN